MPLHRRIPKRGFRQPFPREYAILNVEMLNSFAAGEVVSPESLASRGLLRAGRKPIKILGDGNLKAALTVRAHAFSQSAEDKITRAGGKVERLA